MLRPAGWSRRDVQRFLIEHTRRSRGRLQARRRGCRARSLPDDETTWRYLFERPDDILIACAGGRAGSWSACLPGWGDEVDAQPSPRASSDPRRERMKLFDPTSQAGGARRSKLAPRPAELAGLRLGLVDNTKFNSDTLLHKLAERLRPAPRDDRER